MTAQTMQEEKASTQERILLAAEEQFAQNGYAGTRVSDIAEAADVNVALISYYFESKENLYRGVLERLFGLWEQHVREAVWDGDDPERVLAAYIRKHFEFKRSNLNMVRIFQWESLINMGIYEHYIHQYWEKDVHDKFKVLERWKQQGKLAGQLNERALLTLIWGMMDRLLLLNSQSLALFLGDETDLGGEQDILNACTDAILQLALYGAMPRGTAGASMEEASSVVAEKSDAGSDAAVDATEEVTVAVMTLGTCDQAQTEVSSILGFLTQAQGVRTVMPAEAGTGEAETAEIERRLREGDATLIVVHTEDGELTEAGLAAWQAVRAAGTGGLWADRPAAVWVVGGDREAQSLQLHLEQQLGRLGAFPLSRRAEQTPEQYGARFAEFARRMKL
ncbi:hypothetical protein PA598K_01958 [Paenibacillus sp. 598K]|uniref:TetR/AcrR family transcriptional regulator n=1 Tax=Paenibacillus sp. 598K TaxID=1117987 RepID=UPI000FFAA2F8|nr:TetR family transcriptional regulator [Paenibacillus sp. 598K]GBF73650.1 hypothetical protein PA598K_01958 [Paenibacillus sp. 598K]